MSQNKLSINPEQALITSLMRHVTSVRQFNDKALLDDIFSLASSYKQNPASAEGVLKSKVVATLFYEPSTRTRLSFEAAVERLGGKVISTENAGQFSSAAKGETVEDTIKTVNGYADAIVLRHPDIGAAERSADVSGVPVINAGDGAGEHPTQALLDLFTIIESKGRVDGLKIGLVGDLLNGRTIHSLVQLLSMYDVELFCIAPDQLQLPEAYRNQLTESGVACNLCSTWDEAIDQLDVIYVTRVQKERFASVQDYEDVKDSCILNSSVLKQAKEDTIIMHPLPRVNEITSDIDSDPRALYFEQAHNGLYVRMALLTKLLKR